MADIQEGGYTQKQDKGKAPFHLLDPYALEQLTRVLEFGAKKYSPNGWREGVDWNRTISAIYRHLTAFQSGQTHDPETGLNHMAHVMCNAMFLVNWEKTHPEKDDRWKPEVVVDTILENQHLYPVSSGTIPCPDLTGMVHIGRYCINREAAGDFIEKYGGNL